MKSAAAVTVALLVAAAARAGLKVERVLAGADGVTVYAMDARDVGVAEAVEAFRKQTGIDVVLNDDADRNDRGPPTVYDVRFDGLSQDQAVRELARALGLGVLRQGQGPVVLSRNSWSDAPESHDTAAVTLSSVTRTQSFPPSPNRPDGLTLGLRVFPGRQATAGAVTFDIESAVDEQGRTLVATPTDVPANRPRRVAAMTMGDSPYTELGVSLALPLPRPKAIAVVKGTATLARPKTLLRVTADELPDTTVDGDFDGGTISVGPPTPSGDGFDLPISVTRGDLPADRWGALQQQVNRLNTDLVVYGDNGQRLWFTSRQWSQGQDAITVKGFVSRQGDFGTRQANAKPMRPRTLKWDLVTETRPEAVPFEFHDVAVP